MFIKEPISSERREEHDDGKEFLPVNNNIGSVLVEGKRVFKFNDHVVAEMLVGVCDEKRSGRLVQVRRNCGQFGSNVYLIRLRDGTLMTFENVMIRHADDSRFETAFYRSNGLTPPTVHEQPINEMDTEQTEYTIRGSWPETGFIIDKPAQPETPGFFCYDRFCPKRYNP